MTRRILPWPGRPPGNEPALIVFDDMILPNVAPGQCHGEDVTGGADSLSRIGPGEIVVPVPSRLLAGSAMSSKIRAAPAAISRRALNSRNHHLVTTHSDSPAHRPTQAPTNRSGSRIVLGRGDYQTKRSVKLG